MNHYEDYSVRARIAEFFGSEPTGSGPTAMYFATTDEKTGLPGQPLPLSELTGSLQHNKEIFRSTWDRESLLADINIEYVNFDCPALAYTEFERTFLLLEPLRRQIQRTLLRCGVAPLHLLSGRGHRFIWRIRRSSECFCHLAHMGRMPSSLRDRYDQTTAPSGAKIDHCLGHAFVGLGRIIEYIAAETKKRCAPVLQLPIELFAIEVGPGQRGREMISFDISQYGDPLYVRFARAAYSRYREAPLASAATIHQGRLNQPPLFVIPFYEMNLIEALHVMRDPKEVIALAGYAPARIPDCSDGTENLLNSYLSSDLAQFHSDFYADEPDPRERWPETYDRIDMQQLPSCIQLLLQKPNDLLLRPSSLRRVVLTLMSLGWHPRRIAGLIQSRFQHDFAWGNYWDSYDPATRAEFFSRVFAGLVIAGYDDLIDFNCCSTQEQKICFQPNCQDNLMRFRTSLLDRRKYGRLARRPFHRLFLPTERSELS